VWVWRSGRYAEIGQKRKASIYLLHVQCQPVKLGMFTISYEYRNVLQYSTICFPGDQVQKRVQIRMDALHKYIDTILENACKLVTEQFASSGFSISNPDLPDLSPGGVMCGPNDTLSNSVFNQLSVSSIGSHSPGGKPSPSGMEGPPLLLQKSPELKRRSS
jgi:hypothetical protein